MKCMATCSAADYLSLCWSTQTYFLLFIFSFHDCIIFSLRTKVNQRKLRGIIVKDHTDINTYIFTRIIASECMRAPSRVGVLPNECTKTSQRPIMALLVGWFVTFVCQTVAYRTQRMLGDCSAYVNSC